MSEKQEIERIEELLKDKEEGILLDSESYELIELLVSKISKLEKVREVASWIDKETHIDKCKQTGNYEVIVDMDQNRMGDMFSELRQALKELEE